MAQIVGNLHGWQFSLSAIGHLAMFAAIVREERHIEKISNGHLRGHVPGRSPSEHVLAMFVRSRRLPKYRSLTTVAMLATKFEAGITNRRNKLNSKGNSKKPRNLPSMVTEAQAQAYKMCPLTIWRDLPRHCVASSCGVWVWVGRTRDLSDTPDPVGRCGLIAGSEFPPFPIGSNGTCRPQGVNESVRDDDAKEHDDWGF